MSEYLALQRVDAAISCLRLYLAQNLISSFDGKEIFEPNRDWSTILECCATIRANNHYFNHAQRENMENAISQLQSDLNIIVETLRVACAKPERERELLRQINKAAKQADKNFSKSAHRHHEIRDRTSDSIINYVSLHKGDIYSNISKSTIVSRSAVENAFNALSDSGSSDAALLIAEIGNIVASSSNHAAGAVYAQMVEQASKQLPDKDMIKSYWEGLVAIIPAVASMNSDVLKAFGII